MVPLIYGAVVLASAAAVLLPACGGGGAHDPAPPGENRSLLQVQPAAPAQHQGLVRASRADAYRNELRAPDGLSASPYCLLRVTLEHEGDGSRYDLSVSFEPQSERVLAVTLLHPQTRWFVATYSASPGAARLDLARRQLTLERLSSTQGMQVGFEATLDGLVRFPAGDSPLCGAA